MGLTLAKSLYFCVPQFLICKRIIINEMIGTEEAGPINAGFYSSFIHSCSHAFNRHRHPAYSVGFVTLLTEASVDPGLLRHHPPVLGSLSLLTFSFSSFSPSLQAPSE